MTEYSFANGYSIPIEVIDIIDKLTQLNFGTNKDTNDTFELVQLLNAHQILATLIKPALPHTILMLHKERNSRSWLNFLGPVSIIRQMMVASICSLLTFILLATSADVTVGAWDMMRGSGLPLLKNLLFYLAAAGLGAGFVALYKANSYITKGTYNPTYHTSYWIRFFLGLISGLVISIMFSDAALNSQHLLNNSIETSPSSGSFIALLHPSILRPMLAMLGGFSADLLHTILTRLVETIESLFRGSNKSLMDMKKQEVDALLTMSKFKSQIDFAKKLLVLKNELSNGTSVIDIQIKIEKLFDEIMD